MAWSTPTSRSAGYVVPHTEWNQNVVDNPVALRAGGIAITSQAANDLIVASSATQLGRVAAPSRGAILYAGASGAPSWLAAGTDNYVLTATGAGSDPAWEQVTSITSLFRQVTSREAVNDASEYHLLSTAGVTITGNTLSTNKSIAGWLVGSYANNTGGNQTTTIKVKYGATTFATLAFTSVGTVNPAGSFYLEFKLSAANATNAQVGWASGRIVAGTASNGTGAAITTAAFVEGVYAALAEDSTADKTFAITATHGAASSSLSIKALAIQATLV